MNKLLRINVADNVLIVCKNIVSGDEAILCGNKIIFEKNLAIGHKVAATDIKKGERIIKFGVPIGTATGDISVGEHIHLHNMKSDYISTYTLDNEFIENK